MTLDLPDIEQEKEWFREFGERVLGQLRHSAVDHNPGTYHAQSLIKAVSDRFLRATEAEWAFALEAGVLQWLIKTIFEPVLGGVDEITLFEWRDKPRRHFFRIVSSPSVSHDDIALRTAIASFRLLCPYLRYSVEGGSQTPPEGSGWRDLRGMHAYYQNRGAVGDEVLPHVLAQDVQVQGVTHQ